MRFSTEPRWRQEARLRAYCPRCAKAYLRARPEWTLCLQCETRPRSTLVTEHEAGRGRLANYTTGGEHSPEAEAAGLAAAQALVDAGEAEWVAGPGEQLELTDSTPTTRRTP